METVAAMAKANAPKSKSKIAPRSALRMAAKSSRNNSVKKMGLAAVRVKVLTKVLARAKAKVKAKVRATVLATNKNQHIR